MATGKVTYYEEDGGYGFIETPYTKDNVYFHISDIDGIETIDEGVPLQFEIRHKEQGMRAQRITVLDDE